MFTKGFRKVSGVADTLKKSWNNAKHLDHAGLGLLATVPAYHAYKAVKEKDKESGILAGAELGGLGLLSRAVQKGH